MEVGVGTKADELEQLERQIEQLETASGADPDARKRLRDMHDRVEGLRKQGAPKVDVWARVELARHPQRPYTLDYVQHLFTDFSEIHGDRVMVIGTQKGRDTKQKVYRNFGMPNPEGYRKAIRAMQMAEKFGRPIITFIDTPGAYPGLGAEERGQGEAIAYNLREMARIAVPIVCVVTGEGGSGGALAIGVGNRVLMLEHAIYSVISPEGCAAILWGDAAKAPEAAEIMKITATDLQKLGVIDEVVAEPAGG